MDTNNLVVLLVGMFVGGVLAWFIIRSRLVRSETLLEESQRTCEERDAALAERGSKITELNQTIVQLSETRAAIKTELENEKRINAEKVALIADAEKRFADAFAALSKKALDENNQTFVTYAELVLKRFQQGAQSDLEQRQTKINQLVNPIKESLDKVESQMKAIELERQGAYSALREQVTQMAETQVKLRESAAQLVGVLRNTKSRGQWGEIQLRRVVEIAGMTAHCDFVEQETGDAEGGKLRPDLIVKLPADRTIIVDAKAPMDAFLDAHDASDEAVRRQHFIRHSQLLRGHVAALSKKQYWESFKPSPEFVLLFLPNEAIYSQALEYDPKLIEDGANNNVIIATPATLIALLKAAAYGWKQESIAKEVQNVGELGRTLYERLRTMTSHVVAMRAALEKTVESFNKMVGSLESRVLISARKFKEMNVIGDSADVPELPPIETTTRQLTASDFEEEAGEREY